MNSVIAMEILEDHISCLKRREKFGVEGNPHEDKVDCSRLRCFRGCRKWCAAVVNEGNAQPMKDLRYTPDWLLALERGNR